MPDATASDACDLRHAFSAMLDARATAGRPLQLWLRDDDAVAPGAALDRLFDCFAGLPLTLAVIPAGTGAELAAHLEGRDGVRVAVHGWSHRNHAGPGEKAQELGAHRPAGQVLAELAAGRQRLAELHGPRALPLLVPPWNRIDADVVRGLPGIGFTALSTFGPRRHGGTVPLREVNSHLDIIDWHGTRGGREPAALWSELLSLTRQDLPALGVLTHHLVHDALAWSFLADLVDLTRDHPGAAWVPVERLVDAESGPSA